MTENTRDNLLVICFLWMVFNIGFLAGVICTKHFSNPCDHEQTGAEACEKPALANNEKERL